MLVTFFLNLKKKCILGNGTWSGKPGHKLGKNSILWHSGVRDMYLCHPRKQHSEISKFQLSIAFWSWHSWEFSKMKYLAAYTLANILFVNGPRNALTSWESRKLQPNIVPIELWTSFVFVKKPMEMVRNELFANPSLIGTNYTNIVFANGFLNTI